MSFYALLTHAVAFTPQAKLYQWYLEQCAAEYDLWPEGIFFPFLWKTDLATICLVGGDASALLTAQQTFQVPPPGDPEAAHHCQNFKSNEILYEFFRMCLS